MARGATLFASFRGGTSPCRGPASLYNVAVVLFISMIFLHSAAIAVTENFGVLCI